MKGCAMKVLVVEDDDLTRQGLVEILRGEGYETIQARDGQEALERFEASQPDLICLDIMMPKRSGYDVCRAIRKKNSTVPLIFITAKSEEIDCVLGLELGADDFIVKPFGVKEVVARLRAVTRRALGSESTSGNQANSFWLDDLEIFPQELRARRGQEVMELSLREASLLQLFFKNPGVVLDRNRIFDACWGIDHLPNTRTLDQHISKLRKRIERDPKTPRIIKTVHGAGYRYDPGNNQTSSSHGK
jgi:two-component system, OmpR family, alkaline phosphatase synthesis response regulator PhoP